MFDRGHENNEMSDKLRMLFDKMDKNVLIRAYLYDDNLSNQLSRFMEGVKKGSEKIQIDYIFERGDRKIPRIEICNEDGEKMGITYYGVPEEYEITSFLYGILYASGFNQNLSGEYESKLEKIDEMINLKIMITVTCSMCPPLVMAAEFLAAKSSKIDVEIYDAAVCTEMRTKYNVMSVPYLIVGQGENETVNIGMMDTEELIDLIVSRIPEGKNEENI